MSIDQGKSSPTGGRQAPLSSGAPSVGLPKGGGAIRGIGEKFAANPVTGTGSTSVPIATSPGRSGFGPQLSLSYDSGSGNGPFGFGWSLSLPSITRKTDQGLPLYDDAGESDVFVLAGTEDLVPVLVQDEQGAWVREDPVVRTLGGADYSVARYRPRVEGTFARFERWTNTADPADVCWRAISGENVTTWYGRTAESRIADPADPRRVFSWLVCHTHDDQGNAVVYGYKPEDSAGVPLDAAHERHRTEVARSAQRYPKRIRYGNRVPFYPGPATPEPPQASDAWHFEVVFDYGDDGDSDGGVWPLRPDPFSVYRAGFEVRTMRLCRRVLLLHHFPGEPGVGDGCLVRSTDFAYTHELYSFLRSVTQMGYRRGEGGGFDGRALPPVEFDYSRAAVQDVVEEIDPRDADDLPAGLDGSTYRWADLHGEGIPGILTEQAGAWFYKRNLSPIEPAAGFAPLETVALKPNVALGDGAELMDLAGDGLPDVVVMAGATPGLYEHDGAQGWQPLRPFASQLTRHRDLRFVDLDGNGRADVLVTEDDGFVWHASLGEEGFGPARRVAFADSSEPTYLADLTGDGLTDLVRIRNGEVCYWPNLGHGRFGAKVTMDGAPWFDHPDQFDQARLRLADIDGSGTTDLIYLHRDGVRLYFNQSGNGWSQPHHLKAFPRVDDTAAIMPVDLLGNGTTCLTWSSPWPGDRRRPLRYVNLMGRKPHLLTKVTNNLGAEIRVEYAPSTKFYLADRRDGRPWSTRLPFPVHVVERVETYDHVSRNRFATRYAYHDGYFDGDEREFRGFGMVEQWDTAEFATLAPAANTDAASHVPPVHTKSWFHTGAQIGRTADVLPGGLTAQEEREARRALKGSMLRQEVYADDAGPRALVPYSAEEQSYTVRTVQPLGPNRHAVYFAHPREEISYLYERNLADPRVQHSLTLEVDEFGNVLKEADIAYGRLPGPDTLAEQTTPSIVYTENRVTIAIDSPDVHRNPLPCETRTFELTGHAATGADGRYTAADILEAGPQEIAYEDTAPGAGARRRPIEWERTLYRRDDLTGLLPLGDLQPLAVPGESYRLAFTPGLLAQTFEDRLPDPAAVLEDLGGYRKIDGQWWIPSGRSFYSPGPADDAATELAHARQHFFRPRRYRDPFGQDTIVALDAYDLLVVQTRDPLGNTAKVEAADYRVLQPRVVSDLNGNRSEVAFDILGLVVGSAAKGKPLPAPVEGDTLSGFVTDLTQAQLDSVFDAADPHVAAQALLGGATTRIVYDLDRFRRTGGPAGAATLTRETHASDPLPAHGLRIQLGFSYSDGFGREVQKKAQAEPGPGGVPRWVGTGWTIFNNKGNPVRQYEPFFSATHRFEFGVEAGVSPVLFYDPADRLIATLYPNGTYEKVVFDAWQQTTHDASDTCTADPRTDPDIAGFVAGYFKAQPSSWQTWHAQRIGGALGLDEQVAAQRAGAHAGTPGTAHFDVLGRQFLAVARNRVVCAGHDLDGTEDTVTTRVELDIEGNEREVRDTAGRVVARYAYDMLGNRIRRHSMEAGTRWTLGDVDGRPIRAWDSRGHAFTTTYDVLRRPVEQTVRGSTVDSDPRTLGHDVVFERAEYGEGVPGAEALNLRGRIFRQFDPAGVATSDVYDFKGNLLRSTRRLVSDYTALPDWGADPVLEDETFSSSSRYDALNRPVQAIAPHSSLDGALRHIVQPVFNAASLLERVDVWLERASDPDGPLDPGAEPPSPVGVANIDYDAKGQRTRIDYKNGAGTSYTYDPLTFRLTRMQTLRAGTPLQDLRYVYDSAGNTVRIHDDAQQTVFFSNHRVEPGNDYVYDALYRLVQAGGREHLGQGGAPVAHSPGDAGRIALPHPGDGNAMGTYIERYVYDLTGNLMRMQHLGSDPAHAGWKRAYEYLEPSNRLSRTTLDDPLESQTYEHDAHGNMLGLPHLGGMHWDYRDQLHRVDLGGGGTAHYVYDATGRRARKVWQKAPGRVEERIYLGGFELFRVRGTGAVKLERETLHIMDDQQRIALVELRTVDTAGDDPAPRAQIRYQMGNHLGSAVLELDDQAQVVSYEEYAPYGSTTYQAVRAQTETPKRYRYTGKERDEETGLYYHGARYYAPWLGRWMSCDPRGLVDGLNLYAYVGGNPVGKSDPTGTEGEGDDPTKNIQQHGKSGMKKQQVSMDIDEPNPVGEKNLAAKDARARATDVNNRQFLDAATNRRTKHLGISTNAPASGGGPIVSVADNPNVLLNRNFGQIKEMRDIFDQAVAKVKNPNSMKPTALKEAINGHMWDIIKNGTGESAQKVRDALQKLGFENVKGQGYVMRTPPATGNSTMAQGLSSVDADVDARTGQVVDGPKTRAAAARREAKLAAQAEAKAAAKATVKPPAPKVTPTPKVTPPPTPKAPTPKGGIPAGGIITGVLFAVNVYFAWESYKDGTRPNTPAPVGNGMIGGSEGEGIMNFVGTLAGGAPVGTMLRQAAEFGSTGAKPEKVWSAIKGGSSPTNIGMGIFFGAFR